jgi:hypothetical protein
MRVGAIGIWIRYKDLDRLNDQEFDQFWSLMATARGIKRQQRTPPLRPTPGRVPGAGARVDNFNEEELEDANLVARSELPPEWTVEPPHEVRSCGCQVNAPHLCGR